MWVVDIKEISFVQLIATYWKVNGSGFRCRFLLSILGKWLILIVVVKVTAGSEVYMEGGLYLSSNRAKFKIL